MRHLVDRPAHVFGGAWRLKWFWHLSPRVEGPKKAPANAEHPARKICRPFDSVRLHIKVHADVHWSIRTSTWDLNPSHCRTEPMISVELRGHWRCSVPPVVTNLVPNSGDIVDRVRDWSVDGQVLRKLSRPQTARFYLTLGAFNPNEQ